MPPLVYIHSGVNRPDLVSLLAEEGAAGMVNAQVMSEPRLQWAFQHSPLVPLYLDSGFRRKLDIESYIRLIEAYGSRFRWIANLDCLLDQGASNWNYNLITSRLSSAELRSKILWIYQGGTLCELAAMAEEHGRVGIGGCVLRMMHEGQEATMRWLLGIGKVLEDVGARAHIFGVGNKEMLTQLAVLPWIESMDSSKWLLAYRAHMVLLPSGRCIQALDRSRRECAAKNIHVIDGWLQAAADPSLFASGRP